MYIECEFLRELKNRFLCEVLINNQIVLCYVPSSCRLGNFGKFEKHKALVEKNDNETNRTEYTLIAIMVNRHYVLINLKKTNDIFYAGINKRILYFLGDRKSVKREVAFENYRADFFIESTKTIIELKSIITLEKKATMSLINSERALRQLQRIKVLLKEGYKVFYIFVVMNPLTEDIKICPKDVEYDKLFKENISNGMICKAINVKRIKGEFHINKSIRLN